MEDAIMLFNRQVVPLSAVSNNTTFDPYDPNLLFFHDYDEAGINRIGRLRRFIKGNAYMAIFDTKTHFFRGYYDEKMFWDNDKVENKSNNSSAPILTLGDRFNYMQYLLLDANMKVYFSYKYIDKYNQDFVLRITYGYTLFGDLTEDSNLWNITSPQSYVEVSIDARLNIYGNYILDKKFLSNDGVTLMNLDDSEKDTLFSVIYVLNEILSDSNLISYLESLDLYEPIKAHINLPNRYNTSYGNIDLAYHNLYNEEYFARFRLMLIDFRYWLLRYKDDYTEIDENDLAVNIVNIFPAEELSYLDYEVKTNLIDKILIGNFWVIGDWYFNKINDEEALVKLVRSIAKETGGVLNYQEINDFMVLLNEVYDYSDNTTLYEVLYSKIHDTVFFNDDGQGNLGKLVKAIYNLWLESIYNPHHADPAVAIAALDNFEYTPFNALWQYEDDTISSPEPDESAAPMILNYESEKILLWYKDNYKFKFKDNKVQAFQETLKSYGQILLDTTLSPIIGPRPATTYALYGTYDIFQPIAVKATDADDTIIKMPVKNLPPNASREDFIENCVPIFYLQYVDDLGDYSDAKETIGIALDVILTFTGIGNIAKLRHVKDLSLLRRLFSPAGLSALERVAFRKAISGIASGLDALIAVAHLAHSFATGRCTIYYDDPTNPPQPTDPSYQEYLFCQQVDKWLFALEILALSGDLLARRAFTRATKKLNESIPANTINTNYDSIRTAVNSIDEFNGIIDDFLFELQQNYAEVYNRIQNLGLSREKQFHFMFDFKNQPLILAELRSDVDLIDDWAEIAHLFSHRRNIDFLKSYNFIAKSPRCQILREHIFKGHINNNGSVGGIHSYVAVTDGHAQIDAILTTYPSGYYQANVSAINAAGIPVPKTANGGINSMLPDTWLKQKVLEEVSNAFINKIRVPGTYNQYLGHFSDGQGCIICINGNATQIDNTTIIKTFWPTL